MQQQQPVIAAPSGESWGIYQKTKPENSIQRLIWLLTRIAPTLNNYQGYLLYQVLEDICCNIKESHGRTILDE